MKKIIYFLLASLLVLLAACSKDTGKKVSEEEQLGILTDSGMPIAKDKDKITLKIFMGNGRTTLNNWNDILIWNTYEKMTNIKVVWDQQDRNALEEKRNLALAGDNLPDAFYASLMPTLDIYKYGQNGDFLELNELIEKYAPNLSKLMAEYPVIKKGITFPDGKIYSLPDIFDPQFKSVFANPLFWYNSELLEKYGLDIPETTDEFYQFLKTIKEKDPDIIPYGSYEPATLLKLLRGSYGVGTTGRDFIDRDPETGDIRFYPTTDRYKELLQYVHKLFSEKLIEQNIYSIDYNQVLDKAMHNKYASLIFYPPAELLGKEIGGKYVGGLPLKGPHGDQKWTNYSSPIAEFGSFIITKKNPNPIATMRWVDYFYSDEGSKLLYMGVEGETYEKTADGKYKYLDKITHSSEGLTKEQELAKYLGWVGVPGPGILKQKYFDGSEASDQAITAVKKVEPYIIDETWPPFTYTAEENKKLEALSADIEKYVKEMQDKFVVGDEPFDNWGKFVSTLEKMGLEDYMKIQKAAFERYEKN